MLLFAYLRVVCKRWSIEINLFLWNRFLLCWAFRIYILLGGALLHLGTLKSTRSQNFHCKILNFAPDFWGYGLFHWNQCQKISRFRSFISSMNFSFQFTYTIAWVKYYIKAFNFPPLETTIFNDVTKYWNFQCITNQMISFYLSERSLQNIVTKIKS